MDLINNIDFSKSFSNGIYIIIRALEIATTINKVKERRCQIMNHYLEIANKPIFWFACIPAVIWLIILSLIFYKKAEGVSTDIGLRKKDCVKAFRIGSLAAIGPSLAVFAVMLSLMGVLGGPFAWLRLSIIGSAPLEMMGAQVGAQSVGTSLGAESYDLMAFASSVWTITLNTCGFILFVFLFAHRGEKLKDFVAKKDIKLLAVVGMASILGIMGFYCASLSFEGGIGSFVAIIVALITGFFISCIGKKHPKIMEFSMGISMFAGMFAGQAAIILTT